jgi:SAM-dependent methyltransferase
VTENVESAQRSAEHARRASSFGSHAGSYHRHRPDYPADAIEWALGHPAGRVRVLDLAAGTGKLTAGLVDAGHDVVAVEPDAGMLAELSRLLPEVTSLPGSAEEIPLPDASVDAVVAGQAFHWFAPDRALPEIGRVLRPGGPLAALWNYQDYEVDWVAGLRAVSTVAGRPVPTHYGETDIPGHPAFRDRTQARFPHRQRQTVASLTGEVGTHSELLVCSAEERAATLARVEEYLRSCPHTAHGEFDLPLRTKVVRVIRR